MGLFGRLNNAMKAGAARAKMGGAQAVLQIRLKQFPIDSPRVGEILAELTRGAWSLNQVSGFFTGLGFTYEDFALMYREIVRAAPIMISSNNYLATLMMVDRLSENVRFFRAAAETVSTITGAGGKKSEALTDYIAFSLKEVGSQLLAR